MDLIIVESPSKAKTISKYLKGQYRVDASAGHIRDLPVHTLGVDVKNNYEPKYVNSEGKEDVIRRLTDATKRAGRVYLATDPDREGEAIAWHLQTVLGLDEDGANRIEFNEVWLRWVMLIVGDIITAFGVACFFRTYMPLQVYELFVAEVADRFGFTIAKTKFWFDMTLLALSILLSVVLFTDIKTFDWSTIYYSSFHSIGLGTLVTTAINSPLIALMGKVIDKIFLPSPLFPRFENLLKHK